MISILRYPNHIGGMKKHDGRYVPISLDLWCKRAERERAGLTPHRVPSKPGEDVNELLKRQAEQFGLNHHNPEQEDKKPAEKLRHPSLLNKNFSGLRSEPEETSSGGQKLEFRRARTDEKIDLNEYNSPQDLQKVGLDRLKYNLKLLGLKCGGSLKERAERLYKVKGISELSSLDPKLFAKSTKKRKKTSKQGGRKEKKMVKGPLHQGLNRKPGQKSLPKPSWRSGPAKVGKPSRRDHLGPIL
ncbi:hypothetical protein AAMO2058_001094600 [Amorphochlora amoebiformis]